MATIKMVIRLRRDTTENWLLNKDIIPSAGEPCFDLDQNILKIGDGVTTYEKLKPISGAEVAADGKSIILNDGAFKLAGFDAAEVGAQPRKNAEGNLEWFIPSTEEVDILKANVKDLQDDVSDIKDAIWDGTEPLLTRVESLEHKMDGTGEGSVDKKIDAKINEFANKLTDDGTVNTLKELVDYVANHGGELETVVSDITTLQELVGEDPVHVQIDSAIKNSNHITESKANALFENRKYEITSKPVGTLVDYRDKEIRVMCPADTQWTKQAVGATGNANMYYMGFKAYAPVGAVGFKEGDQGVIEDEMYDFDGDFAGTDTFGRNYSIVWLALASYDEKTDTWTYFGQKSTTKKYIGWDYVVEWYDADGVVIASDHIRINLSNESCHNTVEPYYIANIIKEVAVNGTLLDVVDGRVNITIEDTLCVKGSDEIDVAEDGTLSIKSISFDKLVQAEDSVLVMDGGSAVK